MENNEKKEKLQGGDIYVRSARAARAEREHGKLYRWFDNFWYHHKWKVIIITACVLILAVLIWQMIGRAEEKSDIGVLMAGPFTLTASEEIDAEALKKCLALELPADYDENGEKKVEIVSYALFSKEQVQQYAAEGYDVNTQANSDHYRKFYQYIQTGEISILFIDPWLYEELLASDVLMDLSGTIPTPEKGAILDGNGTLYGVRLGDTALYENNAVRGLPEDTVICLARPIVGGKSSKDGEYQKAKDYFIALIK